MEIMSNLTLKWWSVFDMNTWAHTNVLSCLNTWVYFRDNDSTVHMMGLCVKQLGYTHTHTILYHCYEYGCVSAMINAGFTCCVLCVCVCVIIHVKLVVSKNETEQRFFGHRHQFKAGYHGDDGGLCFRKTKQNKKDQFPNCSGKWGLTCNFSCRRYITLLLVL